MNFQNRKLKPGDESVRSFVFIAERAEAYERIGFLTTKRAAGEVAEAEMHLRRSRQVPRRATRGALRSKVARGCGRAPQGCQSSRENAETT